MKRHPTRRATARPCSTVRAPAGPVARSSPDQAVETAGLRRRPVLHRAGGAVQAIEGSGQGRRSRAGPARDRAFRGGHDERSPGASPVPLPRGRGAGVRACAWRPRRAAGAGRHYLASLWLSPTLVRPDADKTRDLGLLDSDSCRHLRAEMKALRDEFRGEMKALRNEFRGETNQIHAEVGGLRVVRDGWWSAVRAVYAVSSVADTRWG